jgi:hypothetical protein
VDTTGRKIVFMAWGEKYIEEVFNCITKSALPDYPKILITDGQTVVDLDIPDLTVIRVEFELDGRARKAGLIDLLPHDCSSYLFLDSDTRVIGDIELGFEKAEKHGLAMALAPHYSLDYFMGFHKIMDLEEVKLSGQLQYNTGVIFFSPLNDKVIEVMELWRDLTEKYSKKHKRSDQPFFTLALEKLAFNTYTLSPSYNYRGFGELISGIVRIWHSHQDMPETINDRAHSWPARRVINGKVIYPSKLKARFRKWLPRRWKLLSG